ncbi:MAG: hypothetical protein JRH13_09905 [Deltaproteobacteria bacterium]|nr:hypothetical protein [Deltaproteobacteria bacterium]MBW2015447.1 hypothetical protein [Deltaproteobacteria bacterium]MBW2129665.1 hypothetical protein [Deltaproteobacteria bacterium]MBW2302815.1 hypothetical protein [Deltaproteobacteria bacterium]
MITTYQIRNVLRVYGDQLKRRNTIIQEGLKSSEQPYDMVSISMDARRKQMISEMSGRLISQLTPKDHREENEEKDSPDSRVHAERDESDRENPLLENRYENR